MSWLWQRGAAAVRARPSLQRQQRELFVLYLGSLTVVLLLVALVVRSAFRESELASTRRELMLIAEDLAALPIPPRGGEKDLQKNRRDFTTAHLQVEWFSSPRHPPVARLGELRSLGALPREHPGQRRYWQQGDDWIALVERSQLGADGTAGWLRISADLDPMETRLRQLDLTLAIALVLALLLSALSSWALTRHAVAPLEWNLKRLRQFSLDASHELRGPLAAMAANADMGLIEARNGAGSQGRRFEAIASAVEQLQQLVDDLLLLAKQDEQPTIQPERVDFSQLLTQQVAMQQDLFQQSELSLEAEIADGLFVSGYSLMLSRLIRNLLDNARRYTPAGGAVRVEALRGAGVARVRIIDTGVGIAADQLPLVFDRFWRAQGDRSDGGSGLGLAIASRICGAHGGRIQVSSEQGRGSCFELILPVLRGS